MPADNPWDTYWSDADNRQFWSEPAAVVLDLLKEHPARPGARALDLGCGVGRHAVVLARAGYDTTAVDGSLEAVGRLDGSVRRFGLAMRLGVCDMRALPFAARTFELVVSYNVIYHGVREDLANAIQEVRRILRPGGVFFFTCATRADAKYGYGERVAPHAYLSPNSIVPNDLHYFADANDLSNRPGGLLGGFELLRLNRDDHWWELRGVRQLSSHWQVTVRAV